MISVDFSAVSIRQKSNEKKSSTYMKAKEIMATTDKLASLRKLDLGVAVHPPPFSFNPIIDDLIQALNCL